MKNKDKCQISGCRQFGDLIYYGKELCDKHWNTIDSDSTLKEMLGVSE
mgnify:CR=1 FL=1